MDLPRVLSNQMYLYIRLAAPGSVRGALVDPTESSSWRGLQADDTLTLHRDTETFRGMTHTRSTPLQLVKASPAKKVIINSVAADRQQ